MLKMYFTTMHATLAAGQGVSSAMAQRHDRRQNRDASVSRTKGITAISNAAEFLQEMANLLSASNWSPTAMASLLLCLAVLFALAPHASPAAACAVIALILAKSFSPPQPMANRLASRRPCSTQLLPSGMAWTSIGYWTELDTC